MFFIVSKLFGFFTAPSNLLVGLAVCGVVLLGTRFFRAGIRLLVAAVALITIVGYLPVGPALILPLENRFPAWDPVAGAPDGIVVLGGAINTLVSAARGTTALAEGAERVTAAAVLARRYPNARVVFTGGSSALFGATQSEAAFAGRLLADLGVEPSRITLESRSRNTIENAEFTKALVQPKPGERWLLVTSAYHMPRSVGLFRHVGFPVEAYPVDWRTSGVIEVGRLFARASDGLHLADLALHEWAGLVSYHLAGLTPTWLPQP